MDIVIQGSYTSATPKCIESARKHYPDACIMFSTNAEPGTVGDYGQNHTLYVPNPDDMGNGLVKNLKRQIVTTMVGLEHILLQNHNKLVIKVRSDICFLNNNLEHIWYNGVESVQPNDWSIFKTPVGILDYYTVDPAGAFKLPYHTSDWLMVGDKSELLKYFNNAYQKLVLQPPSNPQRYRPEQWLNWANIPYPYWQADNDMDNSPAAIACTREFFKHNFMLIEAKDAGIYNCKYPGVLARRLPELMTYEKWSVL